MPRIESSIVFARPVAVVFRFKDDPTNEPIWQVGVLASLYTTDGPVGVGSRGRTIAKAIGRRIELVWESTEYEPARRVSVRGISGSYPIAQTWTYELADGGTRFTAINEFSPRFGRIADRVIAPIRARG